MSMPGPSDSMNQTTIRIRIKSPVDGDDEPRLGHPSMVEEAPDELLPSGPRYRPLWGRIITAVLTLAGIALVALALLTPEEEAAPRHAGVQGPAAAPPGATPQAASSPSRAPAAGEGAASEALASASAARSPSPPAGAAPEASGAPTGSTATIPGPPAPDIGAAAPGPAVAQPPRAAEPAAPSPERSSPVTEAAASVPPVERPARAAEAPATESGPAPAAGEAGPPATMTPPPLAVGSGPAAQAETVPAPVADTAESAPAVTGAEAAQAASDSGPGPVEALPYRVARAQFTSGIRDREPVDRLGPDMGQATPERGGIYYFTDLRDMQGHTAIHRWEHAGRTVAELRFPVRGARWRVYSSKVLTPEMRGEWQVSVTDEQGRVLRTDRFRYE